MGQAITINGNTYNDVDYVDFPLAAGGGDARYVDPAVFDANLANIQNGLNAQFVKVDFSPALTKGGRFNPETGVAESNSAYARTTSLLRGHGYIIAVDLPNDLYEYSICCYDGTGDIYGTGYQSEGDYRQGFNYVPAIAALFGLNIRRKDGADISNGDISAISAAITAFAPTDVYFLSSGVGADAKKTGIQLLSAERHICAVDSLDSTVELPFFISNTSAGIKYADGEVFSINDTFSTTGFVNVSGYKNIQYKRVLSTSNTVSHGMAFYDANLAYISGLRSGRGGSELKYTAIDEIIEVPSGAVYARFTTLTDTDTYGTFAVYGLTQIKDNVKSLIPYSAISSSNGWGSETATANIQNGEYFISGNNLYVATTAISSGEAITPGTNCTQTDIVAALNALKNAIA